MNPSGEDGYPYPDHPGVSGGRANPAEIEACEQARNEGYRAGVEAIKKAVLDIDAHATPLGEDEDGFVAGGYIISVGCLHRALGIIGHTAAKCRLCDPSQHSCLTAWGALAVAAGNYSDAHEKGDLLARAKAHEELMDAVRRYRA